MDRVTTALQAQLILIHTSVLLERILITQIDKQPLERWDVLLVLLGFTVLKEAYILQECVLKDIIVLPELKLLIKLHALQELMLTYLV